MIRRPPRSTRTDTLCPYTTLFRSYAASLLETGIPVMLVGDFNVIPTNLDVYKPERWLDDALFAPEAKRSEEHTSELQSLMRISYAVFCLKKKTYKNTNI